MSAQHVVFYSAIVDNIYNCIRLFQMFWLNLWKTISESATYNARAACSAHWLRGMMTYVCLVKDRKKACVEQVWGFKAGIYDSLMNFTLLSKVVLQQTKSWTTQKQSLDVHHAVCLWRNTIVYLMFVFRNKCVLAARCFF